MTKRRGSQPPPTRLPKLGPATPGILELDRFSDVGGRFNVGRDVDKAMGNPWPALYLGENFETAFREKFQLTKLESVEGLCPEELALCGPDSFSTVLLDGSIERVFDLNMSGILDAFCAVLRKIKLPNEVRSIQRRLRIPKNTAYMVRTPQRLHEEVLTKNWRTTPIQFGLPAISQIFADLVRNAGFEAIRYPSTKGGGSCIAVFPDRIVSGKTFVALRDESPNGVLHRRLDMESADALCGWELLRPGQRPPKI